MKPTGAEWRAKEAKYFMRAGRRMPLLAVRGEGAHIWDDEGKKYLDFFGGPATISIGHSHPVMVQALMEQAQQLIHVSNQFYSIPQLQLAELLVENSCFDRVYFMNSGAEANEGALKLARKWGKEKKDGAYEVIVTENAFHGRTLQMITAGGTERYKAPFTPLPEGFVHVPFNDAEAVKRATTPRTVAVFIEPIQGEGGINVPDDTYLPALRKWCDEQDLLLIVDEVQTGCGRTGRLFAYEHWGIEPDIMTLGKGIGNGVPLSAFLAKEHAAVFVPGDHGSTYGGEPLTTRVGYEVMRYIIENDVPAQVRAKAQIVERRLASLLDRCPRVRSVRGKGLMWAIEFTSEIGERVTNAALENGLIVNNVRPNAVRLAPPLTISDEELEQGLVILEHVIEHGGAPGK
ncbi:MAG TPA: aspartate aminotransferase family protein [Dehalococcoidia bacterium]|nr:aspartate aminotransferase family protein [Dehalococcoidia bacterium]